MQRLISLIRWRSIDLDTALFIVRHIIVLTHLNSDWCLCFYKIQVTLIKSTSICLNILSDRYWSFEIQQNQAVTILIFKRCVRKLFYHLKILPNKITIEWMSRRINLFYWRAVRPINSWRNGYKYSYQRSMSVISHYSHLEDGLTYNETKWLEDSDSQSGIVMLLGCDLETSFVPLGFCLTGERIARHIADQT